MALPYRAVAADPQPLFGCACRKPHPRQCDLGHIHGHIQSGPWRSLSGCGSRNAAYLVVADAVGIHDHLASNEVRIVKGLRDTDYGLRGFVFADPDGNRIDVGQKLPPR
jgi:hypothetical protein